MYNQVIFYGLNCDRCGETYDSEYGYYAEKGYVRDAACDDGWEEIDGRHYCPNCYEDNPDPDHDDDHEYRPKPAYPEYVQTLRRFLHVLGSYTQSESDGWLKFSFHTGYNEKQLAPEYHAMIDKILHMAEYRIEVLDLQTASNAVVNIYIRLKRFYKGQRVRIIHHKPYRDAYGKEGEIVREADPKNSNACYLVHIFEDKDPSLHFVKADQLELVKKEGSV